MMRWLAHGLGALVLFLALPAQADAPLRLLSYEVMPAAGLAPAGAARSSYDQRAALTAEVLRSLIPAVWRAFRVDPDGVETEVAPGGYQGETNPSLQSRVAVGPMLAMRLAAGLGYALTQESVLVTDYAADRPPAPEPFSGPVNSSVVVYVAVGFPAGLLTPDLAQRFFRHAAGVAEGLGVGYTAFGDQLFFLNLRDAAGRPWSGLEDSAFVTAMGRAAGSFAPPVVPAPPGRAVARLMANDWQVAPAGEQYLEVIANTDPDLPGLLAQLQERHRALVRAAAERYGWH